MTLVANISPDTWPLLIGDLLLSRAYPDEKFIVPTNIARPSPLNLKKDVAGLRQKLAVVSENIIVGWAGRATTAQSVIGELVDRCTTEQFNIQLLNEYLSRERVSTWEEIGIVGLIREPSSHKLMRFGASYDSTPNTALGDVDSIGTGSPDFQRFVRTVGISPQTVVGETNIAHSSMMKGLAIAGTLLLIEIGSGENLKEFYGGGYEVATYAEDRFQKMDDVTFCFWRTQYDGKGVTIPWGPETIFHYSYQNDLLIIRALEMQYHPDGTSGIANAMTYRVPPIYRFLTPEEKNNEPPTRGMNAKTICHFFMTQNKGELDKLADVYTTLHSGDHASATIKFIELPGAPTQINVGVNTDWLRWIGSNIIAQHKQVTSDRTNYECDYLQS